MRIMNSQDQVLRVKVLWQHRGLEETTWEREDMMRATYLFMFKDEGMWFSRLVIK